MYNARVCLPGGNEACHCGTLTLSRAGLVPHQEQVCHVGVSSHSSQVNPSPAVLDPRPIERNPVLELGYTPEDASGQVAAHGDASDAGTAVSGKKAHKIFTLPWRGG
ncbi:hypothetical protein K474DRAFT_1668064 [Panus rudis PR-1116 ss-1]|nr:hypothetical protein K474DRAFT_1668064 [Panus rudis PR-1116 ss-1]